MLPLLALACVSVDVESQHLSVRLEPAAHEATVVSALTVSGTGTLVMDLAGHARIGSVTIDGEVHRASRTREGRLAVDVPPGGRTVTLVYTARFEDDVAAGERAGAIHNFSVHAHVGDDGVFLSDGAAWHPRPLDGTGRPLLHSMSVAIAPIPGWAFAATGEPRAGAALDRPCWRWSTPRPVDGCAIAGGRHELVGVSHDTAHGSVEIVMHVGKAHRDKAPMFLDAARSYLDLYTPLLGALPYRRFTIVENFFSSGFALPGFTLLGPQVVGMAPRSLAPGYLDHELLHNWWGNGVYVDETDGNWCEALTSYCANYYRRVAEGGEAEGRAYRRTTLMKVSADPALDDGPLGRFGSADPSAGGTGRFVGYDKGAFVFMMLERWASPTDGADVDRTRLWAALRRFAETNMGRRASWRDLEVALEGELGPSVGAFLDRWVHEHTVPRTPGTATAAALSEFGALFEPGPGLALERGHDGERAWVDVDPDFARYRLLPPSAIVPLIGGTLGPGGVRVEHGRTAPAALAGLLARIEPDDDGENLLLVGAEAIEAHADEIARSGDALVARLGSFTIGGATYDRPGQAVLHTMVHPDRPGRFITAFHSNGEHGWSKLPLAVHYRRDTTVVWDEGNVVERRTFEPDRRIAVEADR